MNANGTTTTTEATESLLMQLTLREKCRMVSGADIWTIEGCERLDIPAWTVSDGPVGVRGRTNETAALLIPSATAMGASWNARQVEALGAALGVECLDRSIDMLLAPTVNLHRSPRGGRHFEMFSEDPELTGQLAVAYIRGVQSTGVGACVKHFVVNDQEHERHTIDVRVDERTLREVHLRPFELAVREGGVRAVMAAYSYVNGAHACSQRDLLVDLLKDEWAFDGFAVSDWDAMKETLDPARNGLDLEMPGPGRFWGDGKLEAAVAAGEIDEALLDDKVRRILQFLAWRDRIGKPTRTDESPVEREEHRLLVRRAACDGMVLLKNDGLLPLPQDVSVALIGPNVSATALFGGGSAALTPYRSTSVLDAFTSRWGGRTAHVEGVDLGRGGPSVPKSWIGPEGVRVELYNGESIDGEPDNVETRSGVRLVWFQPIDMWPTGFDSLAVRLRFSMTPDAGGTYVVAGAGYGRTRLFIDGELVADNGDGGFPAGYGLVGGDVEMPLEAGRHYNVVLEHVPPEQVSLQCVQTDVGVRRLAQTPEEMLVDAERIAANADVVVLVVGSNAQWETEGADRRSLLLPAHQDELVRRVLTANPRTVVVLNCGAPVLMPWFDDVPAALIAWYPGQEGGDAILDVLTGAAEPGGRMPTTWARAERDTPSFLHYPGEAGVVRYGEERYVGYRWYDARAIDPLVPFGYGCSYTEFSWGEPTIRGYGVHVEIDVPVTNVGSRSGSDVVQVYVASRSAASGHVGKQLVGFAKVHIDGGITEVARVSLDERAFARWDVREGRWIVDPGSYQLVIAASAADVRHIVPWQIEAVGERSFQPSDLSPASEG